MQTIFADFETYYDKDYSLRKMTPVEYILDPRFEAIGCAVKHGDDAPYWVEGPDLQKFFDGLKPEVTSLVTHNALFDACICAWRFGFVPRLIVDTMGISRACLGHALKSHSLNSVALHLGLGTKGEEVHQAIGMHLADLKSQPEFYSKYQAYCVNDVELCAGIYDKLVLGRVFPMQELLIMDMVLRCAINPKFMLDRTVLAEHLQAVQSQKAQHLAQAESLGAGKADLMSNLKFAELLRRLGVDPPTKVSKLTGQVTFAFAKTDKGMIELGEHDNPAVQALIAARVGSKSTIEETRTQRLISIANLQWPDGGECKAPVPLRYSGAHTHRLSGDWKLNFQNLGRKSPLRRALTAGKGKTVIAGDAAQIEARGVACVCGQDSLVEQFERGEDVYASFASQAFDKPITKKDHPGERFIGKTCILGLGFGSGWSTLQNALRVQSRLQLGYELDVDDEQAQHFVNTYRTTYDAIPRTWRLLNDVAIPLLAQGGSNFKLGGCEFEKGSIKLPTGLRLFYHKLEYTAGEWWFEYAGKPEKLYGGKLLENIIQALARSITMYAGLRIQKRLAELGLELALQVHDELCYVVPDEHVEVVRKIMAEEMCRRPEWAPRWPLAAEINTGISYGDAK